MTNHDSTEEIWKTIPSLEGHYEASSLGRIRRIKQGSGTHAGKILACGSRIGQGAYPAFTSSANKVQTKRSVHRAVCEAFHGFPKDGQECNHIDGNKNNNRPENLEWCSHNENQKHAAKHGLMPTGTRNGGSRLTAEKVRNIRSMLREGMTTGDISRTLGTNQQAIWAISAGKTWKYIE